MKQEAKRGRILLIEDDVSSRTVLRIQLNRFGYEVIGIPSVSSAIQMLSVSSYSAVVLDIELEDGTAYDLLRSGTLKETPVIIISVRDSVDEKIEMFELGVDDYMVKPVDARELASRLDRCFKRGAEYSLQQEVKNLIIIDDQRALDLIDHTVIAGRNTSLLTKLEFNTLRLMLADRKATLSREQISHEILGRKVISDSRAVDVLVGKIRNKLAVGGPHGFINSVRGVGYRFDPKDT